MNNKNSLILLVPKTLGTIVLSAAIAFILYLLATTLIYQADILIPEFFSKSFDFTASDVLNDVARNQIIPGWGTLSSIINNPSFGVRVSMIICTIVVVVVMLVVFGIAYLLNKVAENNLFFVILYSCIALFFFAATIRLSFFTDFFSELGVKQNVWFYIVSIVVLALQLLVYYSIGIFIKENDE